MRSSIPASSIASASGITLPEACATRISSINVMHVGACRDIGRHRPSEARRAARSLVGAVSTPEDWQMVAQMVVAQPAGCRVCHACPRQGAAVEIEGADPRLGGCCAPQRSLDRGAARGKGGLETGRLSFVEDGSPWVSGREIHGHPARFHAVRGKRSRVIALRNKREKR